MFKFTFPVITIILLPLVHSLGVETAEPEASLKPRHFNPHPYEYDRNTLQNINYEPSEPNTLENRSPSNGIYSQGPVQFPSNSDDYNENDLEQLSHPYERLALKSRTKVGSSSRRSDYNDLSSSVSKKHYAFSYTVRDATSGDDFSHTQKQEDGAVKGSYKVQLPDGRTQVVKYIADNNGYNAQVTYLDGQDGIQSTQSPPALASAEPIYDYYKTLQEEEHQQQQLQHDKNQVDYNDGQDYANNRIYNHYNAYPSTTPTPYYVQSERTPSGHYHNHIQNVHIKTYNTAPQNDDGERDDSLLANHPQVLIFPTTPAPYADVHVLPTPRTLSYSTSSPYRNVVSPKSPNVLGDYRYYVDYDYRNVNGEASKNPYVATNSALYYKTKK